MARENTPKTTLYIALNLTGLCLNPVVFYVFIYLFIFQPIGALVVRNSHSTFSNSFNKKIH